MAQFDVYRNPNAATNSYIPYLLDLQADLLDQLSTRIVAPLHTTASISKPLRHMNPALEFDGESYVLSTAEMAAIQVAVLGKPVGNMQSYRDEIIQALDFVFTGI